MSAFEVGDCVVLKSGGAAMCVVLVDGDRYRCAWMDAKGEYDEVWIPGACLRDAP